MPGERQFGYYLVTNTGTTTLKIKRMAITGANAGHIAYDDVVCGQGTECSHKVDLAPGGQAFFQIACVAPAPGLLPATLEVESNAPGGATATLTCKGLHPPVIQVSPSGLDFGVQHDCWFGDLCGPRCATQPATQTLTITNAAPAPSEVDLSTVLPADGPSYDFTIVGGHLESGFVLGGGQSIDVTFTYHPMLPNGGNTYESLTLTPIYPAGLAPITVPFHAESGGGFLVIDTPPALGNVAVGQTLTTTITAHNAGSSCLDILGVGTEGDLTLVSPGTGLLLGAGESRSWTVACTAPGFHGGTGNFDFELYGDDPEFQSGQFFCAPVGAGLRTSPPAVDFDIYNAHVGSTVTAQLMVYNPGDQPTELVALTPSDPHYTAALDSGSLPVTVAPGAKVLIDVTFTPTDTSRMTGSILLDASVGSDYTLPVFGSGVAPQSALRTAGTPTQPDRTQDEAQRGGCSAGASGSLGSIFALLALRRRRRARRAQRRSAIIVKNTSTRVAPGSTSGSPNVPCWMSSRRGM